MKADVTVAVPIQSQVPSDFAQTHVLSETFAKYIHGFMLEDINLEIRPKGVAGRANIYREIPTCNLLAVGESSAV